MGLLENFLISSDKDDEDEDEMDICTRDVSRFDIANTIIEDDKKVERDDEYFPKKRSRFW